MKLSSAILICWQFFSSKKEVGKPHIHVSDMKQSVRTYLRDSGWEVKLQNAVYALLTRWGIFKYINISCAI